MLISHKNRFIFVHIYKNAGTSITAALKPFAAPKWQRGIARVIKKIGISPSFDCEPFHGHITATELKRILGPSEFGSFFTFAIVRNPWDWQVSLYKYMLKTQDHFQHDLIKGMDSFDAYIKWRCEHEVRFQRDFIFDGDDCIVDFVGRLEDLESDFGEICKRIGIRASLPRLNVSNSNPYRQFYSDESRRLVEETFAPDIEAFGYEF